MLNSQTRFGLTQLAGLLLLASVLGGCQRQDNSAEVAATSVASAPDSSAMAAPVSAASDSASAKLQDAASDVKDAASSIKDSLSDKSAAAGAKLDDAAVTTKVKAALAQDAGLSTLALNVTTTGGVVTLSGDINNEAKHSEIKTVIAKVEGVVSVIDNTTVKSTN